jgi:hypothetical protein
MNPNFLIQEKVFRAKLHFEMEPTDFILKRLTADCLKSSGAQNTQALFSCLKDWQNQFWNSFPMALTIIMEWANQTAQQLCPSRPVVFFPEDIRTKIWKNFLCRLSLDSWMIIGKNQNSNGNQVLHVMMQVIEDTIYSQFPLSPSSTNIPVPLSVDRGNDMPPFRESPAYGMTDQNKGLNYNRPEIMPAPRTEETSPYEKLFENNPYPRLPSTATTDFLPPRPSYQRGMSTISEVDNEISEDELKLIQNSSRNVYLPQNNSRGMPVKLRRLKNLKKKEKEESSSNKSRSRKRRVRNKPKIQVEDEEDEEEEEEDEEGDKDD